MLFDKFNKMLDERPRELDWREGEIWIRAKGEDFQREAEALDPAKFPILIRECQQFQTPAIPIT